MGFEQAVFALHFKVFIPRFPRDFLFIEFSLWAGVSEL